MADLTLETCIHKYQEFIGTLSPETNDINSEFTKLNNLVSCNKLSAFTGETIKFEKALHDSNDKCYRITNKKVDYYTHTYNPKEFVDELVKDIHFKDRIYEALDLDRKDKCCNCVSFVLYSLGKIDKLFEYLYCLKKSLDNITNELPDFIARFYFDPSIFETISSHSKSEDKNIKFLTIESYKLLKIILTSSKAEVFIYFCENIISKGLPLEKTRTLRFLPLFEDDVNIRVIREADGVISYLDCHNIKLFASNNVKKIAMIYEFADSFHDFYKYNKTINNNFIIHYSPWLRTYSYLKYFYCEKYIRDNNKSITLSMYETGHLKFDDLSLDDIDYHNLTKIVDDNYNKKYRSTYAPEFYTYEKEYGAKNTNFMNYIKLFDVLAGTIALKVKFSHKYLTDKIEFINKIITYSYENFGCVLEIDKSTEYKTIMNGYDEILLYELFDPLITINAFTISKDNNIKDKLVNLFIMIKNRYNINDDFTNYSINNDPPLKITCQTIDIDGNVHKTMLDEIFDLLSLELYLKRIITHDIIKIFQLQLGNSRIIEYLIDNKYKNNQNLNNKFFGYGLNLLNKKFIENNKEIMINYNIYNDFFNLIYPVQVGKKESISIKQEPIIPTEQRAILIKQKYLKYKKKYLDLKNKIN